MINTAMDCLNKCKMDVQFVIYPSHENDQNQQSFQVFFIVLIINFFKNYCSKNRYFALIWIIFVNKVDQPELMQRIFQSRELRIPVEM